jgi:hypothetical protein
VDLAQIKKLGRELLVLAGEAIFGFVTIALALAALHSFSQPTYRFLTKWANQPRVPVASKCDFISANSADLKALPATESLNRYRVVLNLDSPAEKDVAAIVFSQNPSIGVYHSGASQRPNSNDRSWVVINANKLNRRENIEIEAIVDSDEFGPVDSSFEGSACPVTISFFGGQQ